MLEEKKICSTILDKFDNPVTVLGIDGLGGAGKSSISEKICTEFEKSGRHTVLLHIDDFIHVREVRYNRDYPEWQCYYDLQWRYGYFIEILNKIKGGTGNSIEVELYDKEKDCYRSQTYDIAEKTIVVVEGIFLQRTELAGIFDYMVYIDVPEDIRMKRVLKRDTYIGNEQEIIDKYENRYFPAEHKYVRKYRPTESADYVIGD
ncbi:MAG: uridine kinase [Clostridium sp.]|nr:uridine kinase [Clostridium sp.]